MKLPKQLVLRYREIMGDFHAHWTGEIVRDAYYSEHWRIRCGEGRFDSSKNNAAFSKATRIALNFQVVGTNESVASFEFCVVWPPKGWSLMFHYDPARANWPLHPAFHLQMDAPPNPLAPPFAGWRIPLEQDPGRILEYIVCQIR